MADEIIFTDNAAKKVFDLLTEEGNFALNFRAYVTGGGCSGFQYGFTFDESQQAEDTVVTKLIDGKKINLLIDMISYRYLKNSEIDYKEDIEGEQFIIRNPNAETTCGCGSSFNPKEA